MDPRDIITIDRLCDLDRLVAEHVFGWTNFKYLGNEEWVGCHPDDQDVDDDDLIMIPFCSYSMDGAWEVVEHLCDRKDGNEGLSFQIDNVGFSPNRYRCQIGWGDDPISVIAEGPTAPIAICIAALAVKGVRVKLSEHLNLESYGS